MHRIVLTGLCCFMAAFAQPSREARKTAAILSGDDKMAAANNPQCKMYSVAEAARYIGEPVEPGHNSAMGLGCQWLAKDGSGDMIVAIVPASYHEPPSHAKGYKTIPVGIKGFVAPQLDGWVAGAILGKDAIRVSVAGQGASETTAVELLKETIKRRSL
jgi:hypothetical protein